MNQLTCPSGTTCSFLAFIWLLNSPTAWSRMNRQSRTTEQYIHERSQHVR